MNFESRIKVLVINDHFLVIEGLKIKINFFFKNALIFIAKRKNMKTKLVTPIQDAFYLRKRAIIETIFDQLKNIFQVEHSRNRSQINYFNNIFSALIAYNFAEKKLSLKNYFVDTKQLMIFQ